MIGVICLGLSALSRSVILKKKEIAALLIQSGANLDLKHQRGNYLSKMLNLYIDLIFLLLNTMHYSRIFDLWVTEICCISWESCFHADSNYKEKSQANIFSLPY